jgi:hypothetical protein
LWGRILIVFLVLVFGFLFKQFYSFKDNVEGQLSSLRVDIGKLQGEVERIPITLSKKLVDQSAQAASSGKVAQASRSLALATTLMQSAKAEKLNPGPEYFDDVSRHLKVVAERQSTAEAHRALTELASYRSSLEPQPSLAGTQKPIDTSIRIQISMRMNVSVLFGATIFPVYVHGDIFRSPAPPKLSNNIAIIGPAVFVGMVPDAGQTLDGIHWVDGVTFVNMQIRYDGGEVELKNVHFINCTFELANTPLGTDLAFALATLKQNVILKQQSPA